MAWLPCVWLILAAQAVQAAKVRPNPHLPQAIDLIRRLEERQALVVLERAKRWPYNSPSDLARVQLYLGLALAGLTEEEEALESFRKARLLEPSLALPRDVSPRVRLWWQRADPALSLPEASPATPFRFTGLPITLSPSSSPSPKPPPWVPSGLEVTSRRYRPWPTWVPWALIATGGIGLAGGTFFGLEARRLERLSRTESRVDRGAAFHARALQDARSANLLFPLGGALAAVGSTMVIADVLRGE